MPLPEEELYDIQADPFEINNLAKDPDHQQDLERMKNELATWQKETMDFGMIEDSPELEKAFEEYGVQSASNYKSKAEKLRTEIEKDLNSE
jgi:hypothetical protein